MDGTPDGTPTIESLVDQLKARVEERRRHGEYPATLEEDLDAHFRRIVSHRFVPDLKELRRRLADVQDRMAFNPGRIGTDSSVPGGAALHRTMAKLVSRQTQGILEQVQEFAGALEQLLEVMVTALEDPIHVHTDLVSQVDSILERISRYERGPVDSSAATGELRRRVERLEAAERRRQFRPWFGNERFVDEFRGTREELLERYRDVAAHLKNSSPVLDIGCGRGEFLELLQEEGVQASGVEADPELVRECVERGLEVELADGVEFLAATADQSLGGLALIQVVEHLTPQEVADVVSLAYDKLRPGGKLVMESVNPQSLYVFARSFYLDPTHTHPVHPAYLTFLVREAGFSEVFAEWRSPPSDDEVMMLPDRDSSVMSENMRRLNQLLFAPQDYALIATR